MSTLYIVATPIGNLRDITLRALRVLGEVSLIAAEDTRTTRWLLSHYDINTPYTSYHDHNRVSKLPAILEALSQGDVALVSDAGTPAISDPGAELADAAANAGHAVVPIPGPSALTAALSVAGIDTDQFIYLGFLPRRGGPRRKLLESLGAEHRPWVAFEAPHRLTDTLTDIHEKLGDRQVVICRELTKLHEEIFRGTVTQALEHFTEPRGEFTLIVRGEDVTPEPNDILIERARDILRNESARGSKSRDAIAAASTTGLSRNDLYRLWLELKDTESPSDD
ncbi:MAG: 16S rRNA (cytidine(1402)-2'-O)-methyltransferase [Dehalococcoidia bacterium]|nr:16S rRNA (cytidine(1402)-2'-O)-methyltransferase [Dehalococcoidia bacterium]